MKLELKKSFAIVLAAMLAITLAFVAPSARAADTKSEKAKLRARSESRYPEVRKYKSAGKVGETSEGFLEIVNSADASDDALKQLTDDENADRRALYKLISKDQGANVDTVARKAATINFRDAKKGDYLKDGGQWRQK